MSTKKKRKSKKEPSFLHHKPDTASEEIKSILEYLGRERLEGQYRDKHLGQCLLYLQLWKNGEYHSTIARLAIRLGMTARGIRENYFDGLIAEGILSVSRGQKSIYWNWVGTPEEETTLLTDKEVRNEDE